MRKLKKALSLVLAIALVLGLCTIGAAAAGHSGEYITVDTYDGPGSKTDLTVKVVNVSGDVLETIGPFETYRSGSTMTISLNSAYYGVYELEGVSLEKGNVSNWSGSFNDSYEITVTWSSGNSSDTMTVTLKEAEHTLKLENNGISLGTIAYKEGLQRTNVNVYLNYEPFVSFEDVHIANSLNNFVLSLNDGYYYGVADNNLDYSSEIPGQTITYTIGNGDGIYNKLTFSVPSTSVSYQDKLNTIDLYMFTYDDGIDVDFTRAINDNPAHLDLANACEKLDISFTYGGNDYTFEYTEWDQTHKAFLPYDTLINVTPDIKPGYSFDCWKTNDAWGDHANSLYTILEDGTLHEETGAASMEGVYAYSERMAFKYASGFTVGQIILKMVTGSDPYTITYHSNIPGNDTTRSENFYTGAYIDGNPFTYPGHEFLSWNTAADGNGTTYQPHSFYSEKSDLVLYAQWDDDDPQPPVETVNYTVNYYYDNKLDASKTVTGTGTVGEKITSVPDKSGTGYKLDHNNLPFELKENSVDNVINVYYVKDESQTKELTYTVQYVDKDTNEILASEEITVNIWVGDNTYTVTSLNAKTFEGYTFSGETEPPMNVTVHAGDIIKVFYIKDPEPREYAVNYHIVDANGNVMTDLDYTVYLTEDEFEGYKIWQPDGQAGCTFSGWFQTVSDLEANHAQVTKLYAKKWELYGRFTPNVPTDAWLQRNVIIQVDCQTLSESVHKNMDTKLIADSYSSGTLHANADGSWGYSFTVYVDSYLEKYNETYGEHTANDSAKTVNLTFRNGEWQNSDAENNIYAVFDVECVVPTAPTAEQAAEFFKVKLDCLTSNNWGDYQHSSKQYDTTAESVTVGTVVYENGAWTCPVTIDSASYVAAYSEEFGEHTNSGSATQVKKLVYEGGSWKRVGDDVVAFDVKCATPAAPNAPTEDELKALFDGNVNVECVNNEAAHAAKSYGYEKAGLTVGEVMDAGTSYTVKVTIDAAYYQAKYNTDIAAKHNLASGQSTKVTVELRYDNGWKLNEAAPTIKVVCDTPAAPNAPTEDELKALFDGEVFVDCVEKSWHPTYVYGLLANGYTVAGPVKGTDGEYTCTVTLFASAYLAEYNGDVAEKHALASYQGSETVSLKWTGSAWTVINGELPVTFDVVCDTWYPPIIPPVTPSEPVYTPNWLNTTDHVSYIIGYEDGTVKPNAGITRAEVATIFFRLLTDGARERFWSETNAYSDVAAGSWYNIAVSTLSNMGILGGYEDGTFRPNASITRAEFAKIAVSFFDWADIEAVNSFVDVRDSAWYANYVAVAAEIGLIEGYGGNVFRPEATITRAEACTIINRTLGRAPDADHLLPVGRMNTWPDNSDTGVWYYAQIQEATNSHDYRWLGDIEQWTAKLTDPDWDKLQY